MAPTTLSSLIISFVGVAITFLGIILSRIGKRTDEAQTAISNQFGRQMQEISYLSDQLTETRKEKDSLGDQWEARWDRQMDRCRKNTEAGANGLLRLLRRLTPGDPDRVEAERTITEMQQHLERDHSSAKDQPKGSSSA